MDRTQQEIICKNPGCGKHFVGEIPAPEVINKVTVSMVVWAHPEPALCPHCGTPHQMAFMNIQIGDAVVHWGALKTEKDAARVMIPPAGVKLPPFPTGGLKP